jgi:ribosomal protein S6E (S10)
MVEEIKCNINDPKSGKSFSKPVEESLLSGRKIGDKIPGNLFGLTGYELKILGGSDNAGFPMRAEIDTLRRKKLLVQNSVGVKVTKKGMYKRKTVVGNTISNSTAQVNLSVEKYGTKSIKDLLTPETKEEPKTEIPKTQEKPKVEEKKV